MNFIERNAFTKDREGCGNEGYKIGWLIPKKNLTKNNNTNNKNMLDINEDPAADEATEGSYPEEVILYKYIRIEHLESILRTGEIKATQLACANDPMECLPRFEDYHTFREWASEELRFPFVLCLSTKISSPTMWAHYTDGHNGVCLAIKLKTNPPHTNTIKRLQLPENLTIRQSQKGSLVKVIYDEWRSPYFDDSILDEKSQEYKLLIQ